MKRKEKDSSEVSSKEECMNPWNGECSNEDITLYIFYEGKILPICGDCWKMIASDDSEWK